MKAGKPTAALMALVAMLMCAPVSAQDSVDVPKAPIMSDFNQALQVAAERDQYVLIDFWRPG